jgi:hypothetical protein
MITCIGEGDERVLLSVDTCYALVGFKDAEPKPAPTEPVVCLLCALCFVLSALCSLLSSAFCILSSVTCLLLVVCFLVVAYFLVVSSSTTNAL